MCDQPCPFGAMNLVKVIIEELGFEDNVTGPQESFRKKQHASDQAPLEISFCSSANDPHLPPPPDLEKGWACLPFPYHSQVKQAFHRAPV